MLILVAGLDGLGHHVWDTTPAELPEIPRLLQVGLSSQADVLDAYNLKISSSLGLLR